MIGRDVEISAAPPAWRARIAGDFSAIIDGIVIARAREIEAKLRWCLCRWVSELPPMQVLQRDQLGHETFLGLAYEGDPDAKVIVAAPSAWAP